LANPPDRCLGPRPSIVGLVMLVASLVPTGRADARQFPSKFASAETTAASVVTTSGSVPTTVASSHMTNVSSERQTPVRAHQFDVAVGLSYLGLQGEKGYYTDYGGFGVGAAVSGGVTRPNSEKRARTAWVADFSWHHHVYSGPGLEIGTKALFLLGGIRHQEGMTAKIDWFAQALAGLYRQSYGTSITGRVLGGDSYTGAAVTPGFGMDYAAGQRTSIRTQFDLSINGGGIAPRLFLGLVRKL
jgi:hypothetical protein